jgi:thiamine transporter
MKETQKNRRKHLIAMAEGAIMVALAIVLDLLPLPKWPQGGSVSISAIPIIFFSLRRGSKWGLGAGVVYAVVQMIMGFYAPPANTVWALIACVLLDYLFAFALLGSASFFAKPFMKSDKIAVRSAGYAVGAGAVSLIRFLCSFISGIVLWGSYTPEGVEVWYYSLTYNGGYMLPNALIAVVCTTLLCTAVDPQTLKRLK